jgi:tetratricopeptide (TPR) repeat protein
MMKYLYSSFILLSLLLLTACAASDDQNADPILSALEEATNEFRARKNPSTEERIELRREWQRRLTEVVDQNPDSEHIKAARRTLLGLCNGFGEFDQSEAILSKIIDESDSVEEKIYMYKELGEVLRAQYWGNKSSSTAEESVDAFEKSYSLYRSLPKSSQEIPYLGSEQVVSLCMAGRMLSLLDRRTDSAEKYQSARELSQSSQEIAIEAQHLGYDLEAIAQSEMVEWVNAKEETRALYCLDILSKLSSYRMPPSSYALQYAKLQYAQNSMKFQQFVSEWLDSHSPDEQTPVLMAELGISYYNDEQLEKALHIYEALRNKHASDFQKIEENAFRKGRGGYYGKILYDMAVIYLRQGKVEEAENVKSELTTLLPNTPNLQYLTPESFSGYLTTCSEEDTRKTKN